MGDLLAFPAKERTCYECIHLALTGSGSSFCMEFREEILSEKLAAEDCELYEPQ